MSTENTTTNSTSSTDKLAFRVVMIASILVCLLVVILNKKLLPVPETFPGFIYKLPALNAILNGTCSVLLILSLFAIKRGNIRLHKRLNMTAFLLSALFLASYVTAHYFIPESLYGDVNHDGTRDATEATNVATSLPIYFFILISHISLAVVVLPLVLLSFYYGLKDDRKKHRKIVRFSYPIWLYVTVTGVVVYLMISPYYGF